VQQITEENVELAYVDQGYTGEAAEEAAAVHGIQLELQSIPKPNGASYCCHADGSWKEASHGPPAFAAWHAITKDSQLRSEPSTSSSSPAS